MLFRRYLRLCRELFDTIINVKVGPKETQQIFQVHRGVLANSSSRIKEIIEGNVYKKDENLVLELPELDPNVFLYFQCWLYMDKLVDTGRPKYACYSVHLPSLLKHTLYTFPPLVRISHGLCFLADACNSIGISAGPP